MRANRAGWTASAAIVGIIGSLAVAVAAPPRAYADNVTVSGDQLRTGWDQNEPGLAPSQVSASDFGRQFDAVVDGSVYAQPLVIGGTVVVTTEKAKAYGIDAATGAVRWTRTFGAPFQAATIGCGDLTPDLGQTSTPVYDPAAGAVYLTTKIADGATAAQPHWYLHAISPADGTEKPGFPITLQGTAGNDPTVTFDPYVQHQRAGLLLAGGVVYIGFGSHCDLGAWRGFVMAVAVTGTPHMQSVWTPEAANGGGAGIWLAGGGLMSDGVDATGTPRVFLATGNGLSPPVGPGASPPRYLGDSVVRIGLDATGQLVARDFFAPHDAEALDQNDADLASGGPTGLPDSFGTPAHPHLLVQDGKDGRVFLLDRDNLGGRQQGPGGSDATVQTLGPFDGIWGHPAVYGGEGGYVYYVGNGGPLVAYARSVQNGNPVLSQAGESNELYGYTSGSPIVTSSGTTAGSALVWEIYSSGATGTGAQLRAYDAVPVGGVVRLRWSAPIGVASKFAMPVTAGGRVYVATRDGHLYAYGRPAAVALSGQPVDVGTAPVGGSAGGTAHLTAAQPVTVTGASTTAPFSVAAAGLPRSLAAGESLDLPVLFTPAVTGAVTATLTVGTNLGPVLLDLHGVGSAPGLASTPATLAYGQVPTGTTKSLTAVIANTGVANETVTAVSAPGGPYTASGLPAVGQVITPAQSVAVSVTYAPTVAGSFPALLTISSTSGTLTVPLTATAVTGQGHLTLTPAATDLGQVAVGTSRTVTFDIANTGNIPVRITKAKAPAGVFTAAVPLPEGLSIGPEDVVHQQVTFTPTATGVASASYEVTADDGQGQQFETLTATGVSGSTLPAPTGSAWTRNGAAAVSGADLVLTPASANAAGSAFSATAVPSNGLDARFTAEIGGGTGADGLTFTLLDASAPATSLGAAGGGLGYGGLPNAVAVTLDTAQGASDPSANFVGVATGVLSANDALRYVATSTAVGALTAGTHLVDVNVWDGRLRVSVDGDLKIDVAVTLPATVRPGFTAATGTRTDRHVVRDVSIVTPTRVTAVVRQDAAVSRDGRGALTTPAFSTPGGGETLLALATFDGPAGGGQTATVSGAGLTWRLVKRINTQPGTSEIWTATAPAPLTGATVTATPGSTYDGSLSVVALSGASGVGASAAASATTGAPGVTVTTTAAGSWVFGAGNDWDGSTARTPAAGQHLVHQYLDTAFGDTFWAQALDAPTPAAGTAVRLSDTAPTTHRWNLVAAEVLAATYVTDNSPPAVTLSAPSTATGTVPLSATATDDIGVASVQVLLDGAALGAPLTTAPYTLSWDTTAVPNGPHALTARAADQAGNTAVSAPVTVTVSNAAPTGPTQELAVSKDGTGNQTTPTFTTPHAGDLLLAFVSADGPSGAAQTATVTGAGLTWTLVKRANAQPGTSEIWQARATGVLTNATVTASLSRTGYSQSLTVVALTNTAGVGASTSGSATTGAPTLSLTTTATGSTLYGCGNDWDGATARTVPTGQSMVHQWLNTAAGDTFWAQSATPNKPAGSVVTLNDTAPTNHRWNLTVVEVRPNA